jgi:F0F1-type ATP synthase assembly protein I
MEASSPIASSNKTVDRLGGFFDAARLASIGLEMGIAVGLGFGAGYWLDRELGTDPYLTLVCLLFGIAAAFLGLIRTARQVQARARQNEKNQPLAESKEKRWTPPD